MSSYELVRIMLLNLNGIGTAAEYIFMQSLLRGKPPPQTSIIDVKWDKRLPDMENECITFIEEQSIKIIVVCLNLKKKYLKMLVDDLVNQATEAYILYDKSTSDCTKINELQGITLKCFDINLFQLNIFNMYNVIWVDFVEPLEIENLVKIYGNINRFQKILVTDPVAKYLDIKVGEVIKTTDINAIRYRVCILKCEPLKGCLTIGEDPTLNYLRPQI